MQSVQKSYCEPIRRWWRLDQFLCFINTNNCDLEVISRNQKCREVGLRHLWLYSVVYENRIYSMEWDETAVSIAGRKRQLSQCTISQGSTNSSLTCQVNVLRFAGRHFVVAMQCLCGQQSVTSLCSWSFCFLNGTMCLERAVQEFWVTAGQTSCTKNGGRFAQQKLAHAQTDTSFYLEL